MATITLESYRIPIIQIVNKRLPKDEHLTITLQHGTSNASSDTPGEYYGVCNFEIFKESEKDITDKSFHVVVELRGKFIDKSNSCTDEQKKDAAMRELLPHVTATLRVAMALAKIPSTFIPDSIIAEFSE